jgi:putative chitinase
VHAVASLFSPAAAAPAPAAALGRSAPAAGHLVSDQALAGMEVTRRGAAYRESQVVRWSHYDNAIVRTAGRPAGNSRIWGDAPPATQAAAIDALVRASRAAGLDNHDTALVLAIAHTESGFNPDAAAGTTSASGLGQFVDATGQHYGLGNANRWDVDAQAKALVAHFVDNRTLAHGRHQGDAYIYKYHHDGPNKDYGGLAISEKKVMPLAARYQALLDASR